MDSFIIGSASAILAVFATWLRDAWNFAYYNDDGSKREF